MSQCCKISYMIPTPVGAESTSGWQLRCGAVLHRQLLWGGCRDDAWVVGDPVSGCSIASGGTMGEALRRYRALVALHGAQWPAVLAQARRRANDRVLALARRFDMRAWSREWSRYDRVIERSAPRAVRGH